MSQQDTNEQQLFMERAFQTRLIGKSDQSMPAVEVRSLEIFGVSITITLNMALQADSRCTITAVSAPYTPFQDSLVPVIRANSNVLKPNWILNTVRMYMFDPQIRLGTAFLPILLPVIPLQAEDEHRMLLAAARMEVFLLMQVLDGVISENGLSTSEIMLSTTESTVAR